MRVLFMSGYQPELSPKSGLVKEGADFVTKPVTPSLLLKKIREVLDR